MKTKASTRTDVFAPLDRLARNLWWSWNGDAIRLFAAMDPNLWDATHHNPLRTMRLLAPERRDALHQDSRFAAHLDRVERAFAT
jgi:starch phosphorylase